MVKLGDIAEIGSGTPQFRIKESFEQDAPIYTFYSQSDLLDDLSNNASLNTNQKRIRTRDEVSTLSEGDIIFSLISGTTAIVRTSHKGYLYTQNHVKLVPNDFVDSKYLVYFLNENNFIRKQLLLGLQGSQVLKYSLKQVKELDLSSLPSIEKQRCIGDVYLKQLQVENLKKRVAEMETIVRIKKLKEAADNDRKSI